MAITALGIGSGLDLNGLLDQLQTAEREKLKPITQLKTGIEAKISAYGRLEGALSGFQGAVNKLNDPSLFVSTKSSVDGDSIKAAAGKGAAVGKYSIEVSQLARAYTVASHAVEDREASLGAGSIAMTLGNGEAINISVDAENNSLEAVRDAINAEQAGVRAAIVNDGNGYRLALSSVETGTEAAITELTFAGDLGAALTVDESTEVPALNAQLSINSIAIESQSNQVEEAIEGVTLSLVEEGESTLEVATDTKGITDAIKLFVTAYNTLDSRIDGLNSYNQGTGEAGVLLGDATLRNVQSYLRRTMTSAEEGGLNLLSDLGISLQLDGTLELDEEALDELVKNDLPALSTFFAGASEAEGFSGRLGAVLEEITGDSGVLDSATAGLDTSLERLDERYASMEVTIDATVARYRKQFAQLDSMVAQMNSTSSYLSQQFDMMNAQLGRK